MDLTGARVLITGGAGLVGSHLAADLVDDAAHVRVVDDLSKGNAERLPEAVEFVHGDLTEPDDVAEAVTADRDVVFHLAAYTDTNFDSDRTLYEENTTMTYNVVERMHEVDVSNLAFTSSSTVYGEAPMPTPEDYAPLEPISTYGAAKLAEESLLSVYAHSRGLTVWNFRFANVVGPRFGAGVVPDFVAKLAENPEALTILGNGRQEKSYMHVRDCVEAMCHVVEHATAAPGPMHTYNLGTATTTSVDRIADIVSEEMDLEPRYEYTGGDRGWTGDVPKMRLSIAKLRALGWEPTIESDAAVRAVASDLVRDVRA